MKYFLLNVTAFYLFTAASGQSIEEKVDYLPPSPNAFSFVKYGQFDQHLFTGTNVVTIPLYEITTPNLQVPIYLEYASNGIKVTDMPTLTGLSWILQYGGIITREIRDEPDRIEYGTKISLTNTLPEDVVEAIENPGEDLMLKDYFLKSANPGFDSERDVFSFDFLGRRGKFIITSRGEIVSETQSDLDVALVEKSNIESGFVITDAEGIKYYFREKEITSTATGSGERITEVTSWYLTKILHPLGDTIEFTYVEVVYGGSYPGQESYAKAEITKPVTINNPSFISYVFSLNGYSEETISTYTFYGRIPESIIAGNQKVTFTKEKLSSEQRTSITGLSVYDINNYLHEDIKFEYLTGNSRIFMNKVLFKDRTKFYQLEYYSPDQLPDRLSKNKDHWGFYNGASNSTLLPQDPDFPGVRYGNREASANHSVMGMLKTIHYPTRGRSEFSYQPNSFEDTESQRSSETISLAGEAGKFASVVIKTTPVIEIHKETMTIRAGSVSLATECLGETDPDILGKIRVVLRIKNTTTGQYVRIKDEVADPFGDNLVFYKGDVYDKDIYLSELPADHKCQIEISLYGCTKASFIFEYNTDYVLKPVMKIGNGVRISQIKNYSESLEEEIKEFKYAKLSSDVESGIPHNYLINYKIDKTYEYFVNDGDDQHSDYGRYRVRSLVANAVRLLDLRGNYIVYPVVSEIHTGSTSNGAVEYHFKRGLDYKSEILISDNGTSNLNSIYSNSSWGNGLVDSVRYYKKDQTGYSLVKVLRHHYMYNGANSYNNQYFKVNKIFSTLCDNFSILITNIESDRCYRAGYYDPYVVDAAGRDKKYFYYYCSGDHRHIWEKDPENLKQCVASGNNNIKTHILHPFSGSSVGDRLLFAKTDHIEVAKYKFFSHRYQLGETEELDYQNNSTPLANRTIYYYDNKNHFQVTRTIVIRSDGKKEATLTTYPLDYSDGSGFIKDMKDAHLVAYPIEQVNYLETGSTKTILSGSITKYRTGGKGLKDQELLLETLAPVASGSFKFSNRPTGQLPPTGTNSAFSADSRYKPRLTYDSYDTRGNPSQYTQTDGSSTSYLWNYQGLYPVAETKNAAQIDIAYTSFEAEGKGNWSYGGTVSTNALYALTGKKYYAISGSMSKSGLTTSKTYLLSYWQKGGTVSVSGGTGSTVGAAVTGRSYNGWTCIQRTISGATTVSLSGSGYIDQVRLHPVDAVMTSYTYDPLVGITSQTDAKGQVVYYEYDDFQRLKVIRDQDGKLLEDYRYHYRNQ